MSINDAFRVADLPKAEQNKVADMVAMAEVTKINGAAQVGLGGLRHAGLRQAAGGLYQVARVHGASSPWASQVGAYAESHYGGKRRRALAPPSAAMIEAMERAASA